jgi:hypothetical protein
MSMPETGLRTLLSRLADSDAPPGRFDLQQAISTGLRICRWRRVRAYGSVLAAGIAVALLALPAQRALHQPTADGRLHPGNTAPARFSVLVPYASFGWVPPGLRIGVQGGTMSRSEPEQLLLFAETRPNATAVMLTMYPAGKCRLVGTALPCSPYNTEWQVLSRAPDVNGRAAYWLKGGQGLAWQYAADGWAELDWGSAGQSWPPRGAERTAILRTAASIRYLQPTPLMFPYWLAGPPQGWRLSDVGFNELTRGPSGVTLTLTDAAPGLPLNSVEVAKADTIQIEVVPADSTDGGCGPNAGAGNVTLDGARAELSADGKFLCAANVHGLTVAVILTGHRTIRNPAGPDGALGCARQLHLLGSDPAAWTSNPLR